jgi:predicted HicB family RNase H-like nuclease
MYDEVLSERITFRLTPEVRRKLALWAREDHRTLANLVYALVCQAVAVEEQRRGHPFEVQEREAL